MVCSPAPSSVQNRVRKFEELTSPDFCDRPSKISVNSAKRSSSKGSSPRIKRNCASVMLLRHKNSESALQSKVDTQLASNRAVNCWNQSLLSKANDAYQHSITPTSQVSINFSSDEAKKKEIPTMSQKLHYEEIFSVTKSSRKLKLTLRPDTSWRSPLLVDVINETMGKDSSRKLKHNARSLEKSSSIISMNANKAFERSARRRLSSSKFSAMKSETLTHRASDLPMSYYRDSTVLTKNVLLYCPDSEVVKEVIPSTRYNRNRHRGLKWKRFWEVLYAFLAILELMTCSQSMLFDTKVDICSAPEIRPFIIGPKSKSTCETNTEWDRKRNKRLVQDQISTEGIKYRYPNSWSHFSDEAYRFLFQKLLQNMINKAFIVAIIIHISIGSWSRASTRNKNNRDKEEGGTMQTSLKVTGRSSQRQAVLDNSSFNRHFIMKWTRNRIKWNRATTEIARAAAFFFVLQLVVMPIVRNNPFQVQETRQTVAKLSPQLFSDLNKSAGLEATNTTLSLGEILFLKVSIWFHSAAVTRLRKAFKRLVFRVAKTVLFRPTLINKIFMWIRWAKFLTPLVGTITKLRGNWIDFTRKRDQRSRKRKAVFAWDRLLKALDDEHRSIRAARKIQKKFRADRKMKLNRDKKTLYLGAAKLMDWRLTTEIRANARKNQKLLLRPNTTFLVCWKAITVSCVAMEVFSKLLLAPKLSTTTNAVNEVFKIMLAPPVAYLVRLVSFFDVFLSFFTGELDEMGKLVPKPFIKRFVVPGLVLQLIVNPTLKDISKVVVGFFKWSLRVGPTRIFHIVLALHPLIRKVSNMPTDLLFTFVSAWNGRQRRSTHC